MVKNVIKVFARLKKESSYEQNYIVSRSASGYEDLIIPHSSDPSKCSYHQFREVFKVLNNNLFQIVGIISKLQEFCKIPNIKVKLKDVSLLCIQYHKVFDKTSSQDEIFNIVAKPVVSSVIHGFNGTVFAYGPTGSGKTYSITGCPKNYNNRGIIPRCIEYIFEYLNKNPDVYSVHLSYLEIYNEIGYDLLSPKQTACKLEELPRVLMLEDAKGEAHLRNLSIHPVFTEKEAMRFLFLGDTNRTIAETPTNEYSSRSHCIFTIYLSNSSNCYGKQVKSKLHIVDLAGSERVHKSNITGTILNEAKNINLSLHYLEHVILALSTKKGHIPFRNSMLTYLLRDSLCGNSLTTMLATLTVNKKNMEETVSTCRFSRRVSMISTEPMINEEDFNSQQEIYILQKEINELKTKLLKYESSSLKKSCDDFFEVEKLKPVNHNKDDYCKTIVDEFMGFNADVNKLTTIQMKTCLEIMREAYFNTKITEENTREVQVRDLENKLQQKDEEIATLKKALELKIHSINKNRESSSTGRSSGSTPRSARFPSLHHNPTPLTRSPRRKYEDDIKECNRKLDQKYEEAKATADTIDRCKQNIINIRTRLEHYCTDKVRNKINAELCFHQNVYRESILTLREIEKETNHLKLGLLQAEIKLGRDNSDQRRSANVSETYPDSSQNDPIINMMKMNVTCDQQTSSRHAILQSSSPTAGSKSSSYSPSISDQDAFVIKNYNQPEKEVNDRSYQVPSRILNAFQDAYKGERGNMESFLHILIENDDSCTDQIFPENLKRQIEDKKFEGNKKIIEARSLFQDEMLEQQFSSQNGSPGYLMNFLEDVENISLNYEKLTEEILDKQYERQMSNPVVEENQQEVNVIEGEGDVNSCRSFQSKLHTNFELCKDSDSEEFKEFIKSIPLTGDREVDEEIFNFYRSKFRNKT